MSKRRLLFVSHEMTLSGAPIQLAHLVQWLRGRGWETTVVAPEPGPLADLLGGITIVYESQLLIDPAYGALRRLAPQFDAVIANTVATWEAVQACHFERVPVIWYIHETKVGTQLMQLVHMIEPSLALADALVLPTRATTRVYERFVPKPIDVIPYGIPEVARSAESRGNLVSLGVLGTLEQRKGQDVLLAAMRQLPPAVAARASFHLAGRPLDAEFARGLEAAAAGLTNVTFEGALDHDSALRLLNRLDVLVLPSRDETMPIVLLEAMSLGKAIISTDIGGVREWLTDGENALVILADDANALTNALARMIDGAELRGRLGQAGRATFAKHFTLDRFGARFESVIQRTIA